MTSTTPEAGILSMEESVLAYTQCLRDHGIGVDDPIFDGEGGFTLDLAAWAGADPDPRFEAAAEACDPLVEGVYSRSRRDAIAAADDHLYEFSVCMRDHGVADWPDPEPASPESDDSVGDRDPGSARPAVDPNDPVVLEALAECGGAQYGLGPKGSIGETEPGK